MIRPEDPSASDPRKCVSGHLIPQGAPEGLCPQCMFLWALAEDEEETEDEGDSTNRPSRFGPYELQEKLSEGGMGIVYKARKVGGSSEIVALKRIRTGLVADASTRRRFLTEAKAAAELRHPNIVPIFHVGEHKGEPYYTMKLLPGGTLAAAAKRFAEPRRAAALVAKVARAVFAGHKKQILHRDLKPANILLDEHDEPFIADFGIAKRLDQRGSASTVAMPGTPYYMAPEQLTKHAQRNSLAADIWSLGVILYELIAGHCPFSGATELEVIRSVVEDEPEALESTRPGVDRDLATICLTCLQKEPERRYISAEALAEDLERYLHGEPVLARRPSLLVRTARFGKRHPALSVLFGAAAISIVTLTSWAFISAREQERGRRDEVLASNVFAARAIAGTVLAEIRDYADIVAEEARDPRLVDLVAKGDNDGVRVFCEAVLARHAYDHSVLERWFIIDREGYALALLPPAKSAKSIYFNFTFRDYFRTTKMLSAGATRPVYVSRAFLSTNDDDYKFAIASPIRGEDGAFLGLLATTIVTDRRLGALALSDDRRIAILTVRRDRDVTTHFLPNEHILLAHDGIAQGAGVVVESEALRRLTARRDEASVPLSDRLKLPPIDWVESQDDYVDPLAKPAPDGTRGRWLAGIAPVGSTELSVIVQTRVEDATALDRTPFKVLLAWSAVGAALLLLAGLFAAMRTRPKQSSAK